MKLVFIGYLQNTGNASLAEPALRLITGVKKGFLKRLPIKKGLVRIA